MWEPKEKEAKGAGRRCVGARWDALGQRCGAECGVEPEQGRKRAQQMEAKTRKVEGSSGKDEATASMDRSSSVNGPPQNMTVSARISIAWRSAAEVEMCVHGREERKGGG